MVSPAEKPGASLSFEEQIGRNWINLRKFAQLIEKSYPTTLKLARSGKVVVIKVGGNYRVYEDEVRRFLREGNHPNPKPLE